MSIENHETSKDIETLLVNINKNDKYNEQTIMKVKSVSNEKLNLPENKEEICFSLEKNLSLWLEKKGFDFSALLKSRWIEETKLA